MIKVRCTMCNNELNEPGAILLASPIESGMCAKYHICVECEKILAEFLTREKLKGIGMKEIENKYKDRYVLGEGSPFVLREVCQLFRYEKGKAILVPLEQPNFMILSCAGPNYRLVLEKVEE